MPRVESKKEKLTMVGRSAAVVSVRAGLNLRGGPHPVRGAVSHSRRHHRAVETRRVVAWFGGGEHVPSASMALQLVAQWLTTFALW